VTLVEYGTFNDSQRNPPKIIDTVTILADSGLSDVGGFAYDLVLANHFAEIFDQRKDRQGKEPLKNSKKAMVKLLKECNHMKEVLSANKETAFYVEGLIENIDFVSHIDRATFESKAQHLLD